MQEMDQEKEILRGQLRGTWLDLLRQLENLDSDGLDAPFVTWAVYSGRPGLPALD